MQKPSFRTERDRKYSSFAGSNQSFEWDNEEDENVLLDLDQEKLNNIQFEILSSRTGVSLKEFYIFKLIIIGNSGCGKSCLMHRVTTNEFNEEHQVTVGVEFGSLSAKVEETLIKLQIWDTAGQESFRAVTKTFFRGAHAVLLTYSIANMQSFQNLPYWLNQIRTESDPGALVFLIGNQKDLEDKRRVTFEQGQKFCRDNNLHFFIETSAKTNENVSEIFIAVAKYLFKKYESRIKNSEGILDQKPKGTKLKADDMPGECGCQC